VSFPTFDDERSEKGDTFDEKIETVEERGFMSSPTFVVGKSKIKQEIILPSEDVGVGNVEQVSSLSTRTDSNKAEN
jgi:hypothetical protein